MHQARNCESPLHSVVRKILVEVRCSRVRMMAVVCSTETGSYMYGYRAIYIF